jgi:nucleoside-diphosphate-sugar epimerase
VSRTVLITGASGALGPPVLTELLQSDGTDRVVVLLRPGPRWDRRVEELRASVAQMAADAGYQGPRRLDRLMCVAGDVGRCDLGLEGSKRDGLVKEVHVLIHAAANTSFSTPAGDLHGVNVEGTRHALAFARRCHVLKQFLLVSTTCVAGTRTGVIAERLEDGPGEFVNAYERTKWEAERLAAAADLPVRIARLSTCIGGERTGYVHRFGAIHQSLRWLIRGLVPMVPAVAGSRVDLIATDVAARWIARAAEHRVNELEVCQVAAGRQAIPLHDLVECAVAHLRGTRPGWTSGQIEAPVIVDAATFRLFERSVAQSGDVLFARVLEAAGSFFPALLYPKVYQTARAETVWGGPLPLSDWRETVRRVIDFGCSRQWRRVRVMEPAHV